MDWWKGRVKDDVKPTIKRINEYAWTQLDKINHVSFTDHLQPKYKCDTMYFGSNDNFYFLVPTD